MLPQVLPLDEVAQAVRRLLKALKATATRSPRSTTVNRLASGGGAMSPRDMMFRCTCLETPKNMRQLSKFDQIKREGERLRAKARVKKTSSARRRQARRTGEVARQRVAQWK